MPFDDLIRLGKTLDTPMSLASHLFPVLEITVDEQHVTAWNQAQWKASQKLIEQHNGDKDLVIRFFHKTISIPKFGEKIPAKSFQQPQEVQNNAQNVMSSHKPVRRQSEPKPSICHPHTSNAVPTGSEIAGASRRVELSRPVAPAPSSISGNLKGQTLAVLVSFNPPIFHVCGTNSSEVLPTIEKVIIEHCLTPFQLQALKKKPKFEQKLDIRSEEPVFILQMYQSFFDEIRQTAFFVALLDEMEKHHVWRPVIGDACFESGNTMAEDAADRRHLALTLSGGGTRREKPAKHAGTQHHLLFFIHA